MDFTPHFYQQLALDSKARFIACLSGIQGGKTTIGVYWFLREIYESYEKGQRGDWLICAPTAKILQQSTLAKFKEKFPSDWGEWREQRQCFDLSWGNKIFVRSADEPDYLEGMTALGAWIDEAGQIKYNAWVNIQGRLSINQGRAILTTTPYSVNWLQREILKKAGTINGKPSSLEKADKNVAVIMWKSIDNPAFPQEEYERAKNSMSTEIFKRRYDGQFTRLEGLVYKDFDPETCVVPAFPIPGSWRRFAGIDFGNTNPTAIVCVAEKPGEEENGKQKKLPEYYIYREFYKTKPLLREVSEFLNQEQFDYVLGDPSAAQQLDELRRFYGHRRILAAENKIEIGIERIQTLLKENRLKCLEGRTSNTVTEFEEYHYPAPNADRPITDKPVAINNHAMDALKYAFSREVSGVYQKRKTQVMKKIFRSRRTADPVTGYF